MDEYERAAAELRRLIETFDKVSLYSVVDSQTDDEDCLSVRTIISHVVNAGYGYAAYIRGALSLAGDRPPKRLLSYGEVLGEYDVMLKFTIGTLDGRWEMPDETIRAIRIQTGWEVVYDPEQRLEHAFVHILRHRRQFERLRAATPG